MKIIATWSGECFTAKQVQVLAKQCEQFSPLDDFVCITPETIPGVECWKPTHTWPGWWHKYEVFAPHIRGPVLYMDIDTVLLGSLSDITQVNRLTLLRDFYRDGKRTSGTLMRRRPPKPEGLQASLMVLLEEDRAEIWEDWMHSPEAHMARLGSKGDQPMLEKHFLQRAQRWQDVVPGQIVSYKADCCGGNEFQKPVIPADARIVIFHGTPRPWGTEQFKGLYT
jgi:hypothetical protein